MLMHFPFAIWKCHTFYSHLRKITKTNEFSALLWASSSFCDTYCTLTIYYCPWTGCVVLSVFCSCLMSLREDLLLWWWITDVEWHLNSWTTGLFTVYPSSSEKTAWRGVLVRKPVLFLPWVIWLWNAISHLKTMHNSGHAMKIMSQK